MTIPASQVVQTVPSVLAAGGDGVDVIGLVLTTNTRVPIGTVASFPDGIAVEDYFGSGSAEAIIANGGSGMGSGYFGAYTRATKLPGELLFAQFNTDAVAAFMRGGDVSALTLAQLQALSGSLNIVIDGVARNAAAVNLSAATSFSSAAGIIQTQLIAASPAAASVTGSIGGSVTASAGASFTGTGSGTNLTAASVTGVIHIGAQISGTGVPAGTYIVSQTSGSTGGAGVYVTNHATTSAGASLTAASNILDVTAVGSGTLQVTAIISGTGVTSGTEVIAQITGAPAGVGTYAIDSYQTFASTTVTALSDILNVTAVGSGSIEIGGVLSGTNVTAGTTVTEEITGSGGTGTYRLSESSTTISQTITSTAASPVVTYDSVSGAFIVTSGITGAPSTMAFATGTLATSVKLTSATGAVLSQGAAAVDPDGVAGFMNDLIVVNSNWVTFFTASDPDEGSGSDYKQAFAAWKNGALGGDRFAYICPDTDITPTATVPATASLGYILEQAEDSGTCLIYNATDLNLAAFIAGAAASIDFTQKNGRLSFAFKSQEGLVASVTDPTIAVNLGGNPQVEGSRGNGYNFYGAYGTASTTFTWFQRGFVTGDFAWLDSYINQIWLNTGFQADMLTFFGNSRSVPYSDAGNADLESALQDRIQAGLNFGAFGPGTLSQAQIAAVNSEAGREIANTLQSQGYYLQILPATAEVRAARTSPPATFWYIDRGSVQAFNLASVALR